MTRRSPAAGSLLALLLALLPALARPAPGAGQERPTLRLVPPDGGAPRVVAVERHRGYAAVPASILTTIGWSVQAGEKDVRASLGDTVVTLTAGDPFFRWGRDLLQLVDEPYRFGDDLWVPLQLLTDFLPARLKGDYAFETGPPTLKVLDPRLWPGAGGGGAARASPAAKRAQAPKPAEATTRVVVIDPGHGGRDPGATGPDGVKEKDVALAVGKALAAELAKRPGIEVYMTRRADTLIPLWSRGEWATETKGERPGVFISLHANALPSSRAARGFETYFLSEARTEHERRVAALENAPLQLEEGGASASGSDMDFILKDLRNRDDQHWSMALAEMVQEHVASVHPGPDRGVKQAPFAVITNALMPAVLVEMGFITNPAEEHLLDGAAFHRKVARAIADAVVEFFHRYPPGGATLADGGKP